MIVRSRLHLALLAYIVALTSSGLCAAAALVPVPIGDVQIEDEFWSPKLKVWREVTIADCFARRPCILEWKVEQNQGVPELRL